MTQMSTLARVNGAHELVDDALDAAIELEKMRDGEPTDTQPFEALSMALRKLSEPAGDAPRAKFFSPGYYEPLHRLMFERARSENDQVSLTDFVKRFAADLEKLATDGPSDSITIDRMLEYCLSLHSALLEESSAADASRSRETSALGFSAA